MHHKKIAVVVPTIREQSILRFLNEWKNEFAKTDSLQLFIVEDNPIKSFDLKSPNLIHSAWEDIDRELGEKSWIIPRRTDCVRSFGYYQAYKAGADIIVTLDDDCYPNESTPYLIESFVKNLERRVSTTWFNTLSGRHAHSEDLYPRGFPYEMRDRPVALCHGLWSNILDLDGKTQLNNPELRLKIISAMATKIPHGVFFPMCGMNLAVKREIIPAFYFLLMGEDKEGKRWGFDRFGDIWSGIFIKKIIDHLGHAVVSGQPTVHHDRASNVTKNAELETPGLLVNEQLYKDVEQIQLTANSFKECYKELALKLPAENDYFKTLKKAMVIWANLF